MQALWDETDPVGGLRELVRRNLVARLDGQERWRLHDVLRRFALAAYHAEPEPGPEQRLWRQLGLAAVQRLEEINAQFQNGGDAIVPALAELDAELPLLRAVQAWAAERIEVDDVAAEVTSAVPHFAVVDFRLTNAEYTEWLKAALRAAEHRGDKREIAQAAGNLGILLRERGEWDEALEMHEASFAISEELGDIAYMASQYGNMGLVHRERGELGQARGMHEKSLAIHNELGNRAAMARQYGNLANLHSDEGDRGKAKEMYAKSLELAEKSDEKVEQTRQFYNLVGELEQGGDWEGAAEHFRRSLELAEELGMPDDYLQRRRESLAAAKAHLPVAPRQTRGETRTEAPALCLAQRPSLRRSKTDGWLG